MPVITEQSSTPHQENSRKIVAEAGIKVVNNWIKQDGVLQGISLTPEA